MLVCPLCKGPGIAELVSHRGKWQADHPLAGLPQVLIRAMALQGQSQGCRSSPRQADESQMRLVGTLPMTADALGTAASLSAIDAALVARGVRSASEPGPLFLCSSHAIMGSSAG